MLVKCGRCSMGCVIKTSKGETTASSSHGYRIANRWLLVSGD